LIYDAEFADKALCKDEDVLLFFDNYEEDKEVATMVDHKFCFRCPVMQECLETGMKTKSWGVWGGVFLVDGMVNRKLNSHKTAEDWQTVAENIK
jgi:hypothetical protein